MSFERQVVDRVLLEMGASKPLSRELLETFRAFALLLYGSRKGDTMTDDVCLVRTVAESFATHPRLLQQESSLPVNMAAAVTLDCLGQVNAFGERVDHSAIPLIRPAWLRLLWRGLNRIRGELRLAGIPAISIDDCERHLIRFLQAVWATFSLGWKKDDDMPRALAAVFTEQLVEVTVTQPALGRYVMRRTMEESACGDQETKRLLQRVKRCVNEALRNEGHPNDLGHEAERIRRAATGIVVVTSDAELAESFEPSTEIVDVHGPARFFRGNLESPWFRQAATELPTRLAKMLSAN